jgi:hypothetical protein
MGMMGPRARAPMKLQLAVNRRQRQVFTRISLVDLIRARAVTPERRQVTTSPAPTGAAAAIIAWDPRNSGPRRKVVLAAEQMNELRQNAVQVQKEMSGIGNEDLHGATFQLHHVAAPTGAGPSETARQVAELTLMRLLGKPAIEAAQLANASDSSDTAADDMDELVDAFTHALQPYKESRGGWRKILAMPLMIAEGGLLSVLQTVLGKTSEDLQAYLGCLYVGDGLRLAIPANYHAEAGAMDTFAPPKIQKAGDVAVAAGGGCELLSVSNRWKLARS